MKKTLLRSIFAAVALLTTGLANAQTEYQYTFSESRATVEGEKTLTLEILDADARETKLTEAAVVTFSAMEGTKTTAVEGTDYELSAKTVTIPAGENKATITVKVIGTITEANNSLRLQAKVANTEKQTFVAGDNRYITLTLSAEVAEEPTLSGTWQMHQLVTDKAAMDAAWGGMATYGDAFPAFNAQDWMVINSNTLEPYFASTFKNFFTGEAQIEVHGKYTLRTGVGAKVELDVLKVTGVNRNFDANSQSESNVAYVGFRLFNDTDGGKELLDVYLIDYQSTSFASELADYGMYGPDGDYPYMATMTGMYINFTMERTATDIEGVEAELPAVAKGIYNLQGQKLQKLQRGVNIVNGKKVVVK